MCQHEGHVQPEPEERNQDCEGTKGEAMGSDPLVETGFEPKKVADGGNHQVHHERRRAEKEGVVCVEER